ncbi:hypothetical protein A5320_08140 [Rheinheimera sp. SA_1]|nr:hypothetical protein A5320_08140 [Rheinheimera sp. SA_1]
MFSSKLAGIVARFITPMLRFQTLEDCYVFAVESYKWRIGTQASPSKGLVYIAARRSYLEFEKVYPIESSSDLKAVLNQQFEGRDCIHLIQKTANHQSLVKTFIFDTKLISALPAFSILLPESVVLHAALQDRHCKSVIRDEGQSWFLYVRAAHFSSQISNIICGDLDTFSMVNGVPQDIEEIDIQPSDKPALLMKGLKSISPTSLLNFIRYKRQQAQPLPWREIGVSTVAGLLCYLSLSSFYLHWTESSASKIVASFGSDVDLVMTEKQQVEELQLKLNKAQQLLLQHENTWPVWSTLLHLLDNGVSLSSFQWQNGHLIVKGTTPVATGLIEALTKLSYVSRATFTDPTRRERDLDSFSIKIEFRLEAEDAKK